MSIVVDVVMPVYNAAPYLIGAIESILHQTWEDFNFIIVDDGSIDGSWDILERYAKIDPRIVLLHHKKNYGISRTRNDWFAHSKAKYIIQMDADDISHPQRIAKQVAFMEQHPHVGVCGCSLRCIDESGAAVREKIYPTTDNIIRKYLFLLNPIPQTWVIVRKEAFQKAWWYDLDYVVTEDLQFWFAIGRYSALANLNEILVDYRVYPHNSSHKKIEEMIQNTIKARRQAIKEFGYTPSRLWYILLYTLFIFRFLPAKTAHRLFYFFRPLMVK